MSAPTPERLEDIKKAFAYFDANGDGKITKDELEAVVKEAGLKFSEEQIQQFMQKIDTNGSGAIELDEFCVIMTSILADVLAAEKEIKDLFHTIDKDGDGKIDKAELKDGIKNFGVDDVTDEDVQEIIDLVDTDKDGHISYDEFVTMLYMLRYVGQEEEDA